MALFEGKQNVHLYVRFLAKLGAPLSSELLNTLSLLVLFSLSIIIYLSVIIIILFCISESDFRTYLWSIEPPGFPGFGIC